MSIENSAFQNEHEFPISPEAKVAVDMIISDFERNGGISKTTIMTDVITNLDVYQKENNIVFTDPDKGEILRKVVAFVTDTYFKDDEKAVDDWRDLPDAPPEASDPRYLRGTKD